MADHRSIGSLLRTLHAGDSSDLQMALHYLYLHVWANAFGSSEWVLRASNIPFIVIFAFALVWCSWRVFQARWIWVVAAVFPFVWFYAREARAYMALIALSTFCFACLLAYLTHPSARDRRVLPWLVLGSLFLGAGFHMLMLLAVVPMLVLLFRQREVVYREAQLSDWRAPLLVFSIPFTALLVYFAWTFLRGTAYAYAAPSFLSMGSVVYRFLGLFGYGPNRHYDISFRPYLLSIGLAGTVFVIAVSCMLVFGLRRMNNSLAKSLLVACVAAVVEVGALSVISRQQIDMRHLAALTPLVLLSVIGCLRKQPDQRASRLGLIAALLLSSVWLISDLRLLYLPEYQLEDYRSAINEAISFHRQSNGSVVLVADPAAAAYYGLDLTSTRPCFPLADNCSNGFSKVAWAKKAPAVYGVGWSKPEIESWWAAQARKKNPIIVVMNRTRHPMYEESPWWPILLSRKSCLYSTHGFFVFLIQ